MSGLVKATASSGAVGAAASGVVRSSDVEFGSNGVFFEDFVHLFPTATKVPSRSIIGRGVTQQDNRSAIRSGGKYFQRKYVWQATIRGIEVWELRRLLDRLPTGALKPNGKWFVHLKNEYESVKVPTRRHGVVPFDQDHIIPSGEESPQTAEESNLDPYVLAYLPSVVQRYAMNNVISPVFTQGEIWQKEDSKGIPYSQSIEAIRLGKSSAIVITAVKEIPTRGQDSQTAQRNLASHPWTVTQSTFQLQAKTNAAEIDK